MFKVLLSDTSFTIYIYIYIVLHLMILHFIYTYKSDLKLQAQCQDVPFLSLGVIIDGTFIKNYGVGYCFRIILKLLVEIKKTYSVNVALANSSL